MNSLLNETATQVAKEFDLASSLLDAISLVPTSPDEDILQYLEREIKNCDNVEEVEEAKRISCYLSTLWKLEASIPDYPCQLKDKTFNESEKVPSQKMEESLLHTIVSLAISLRDSRPSTRQFLLELKNKQKEKYLDSNAHGEEEEQEDDSLVPKLKEYLVQLKDIGHQEISTSVCREQQITSSLFKLIEKCNVLEEEKIKMSTSIDEKELELNQESIKLNEILDTSTKALEQVKIEEKTKEDTLDKQVTSFLEEEEKKHGIVVESLQSELANAQRELCHLREVHAIEQEEIMKQRKEFEEKLSKMTSQYKSEEKGIRTDIQEVCDKILKENNEKEKLEQLISLQVQNDNIKAKEEALIQSVIDLESQADAILFDAATNLQKLYRGARDRAMVKVLKKKSKKGKKGKGKKSKKK